MRARVEPKPGQESVWDYPRPPRLERTGKSLVVVFGGVEVARTTRGLRMLETSHPPVYYVPEEDVVMAHLVPTGRTSYCEYKGMSHYFTVRVGEAEAVDAAWGYARPAAAYAALAGHVAFYASRMEACYVDGEKVTPQPGGFYGGWVTADVVGPFKGGAGTAGW